MGDGEKSKTRPGKVQVLLLEDNEVANKRGNGRNSTRVEDLIAIKFDVNNGFLQVIVCFFCIYHNCDRCSLGNYENKCCIKLEGYTAYLLYYNLKHRIKLSNTTHNIYCKFV